MRGERAGDAPSGRQQRELPGPRPFVCLVCVCVGGPLLWPQGQSASPPPSAAAGHCRATHVIAVSCLGGPPGRPSPPELAHLRQDGEVLILVLLQLEGRGGTAVAQGPEGTRPSALLPNGA